MATLHNLLPVVTQLGGRVSDVKMDLDTHTIEMTFYGSVSYICSDLVVVVVVVVVAAALYHSSNAFPTRLTQQDDLRDGLGLALKGISQIDHVIFNTVPSKD